MTIFLSNTEKGYLGETPLSSGYIFNLYGAGMLNDEDLRSMLEDNVIPEAWKKFHGVGFWGSIHTVDGFNFITILFWDQKEGAWKTRLRHINDLWWKGEYPIARKKN